MFSVNNGSGRHWSHCPLSSPQRQTFINQSRNIFAIQVFKPHIDTPREL